MSDGTQLDLVAAAVVRCHHPGLVGTEEAHALANAVVRTRQLLWQLSFRRFEHDEECECWEMPATGTCSCGAADLENQVEEELRR